jgi:hypothetical protein
VIIFNTDYANSLEEYWKSFAGKLEKEAFVMMMREYVEKVPHGFIAIVNDPNIALEDKFFYGLAEETPVSIDYIVGAKEFWMGSEKQLQEIADGTMKKKREKIDKLSKPMGDDDNLENQDPKKKNERDNEYNRGHF